MHENEINIRGGAVRWNLETNQGPMTIWANTCGFAADEAMKRGCSRVTVVVNGRRRDYARDDAGHATLLDERDPETGFRDLRDPADIEEENEARETIRRGIAAFMEGDGELAGMGGFPMRSSNSEPVELISIRTALKGIRENCAILGIQPSISFSAEKIPSWARGLPIAQRFKSAGVDCISIDIGCGEFSRLIVPDPKSPR